MTRNDGTAQKKAGKKTPRYKRPPTVREDGVRVGDRVIVSDGDAEPFTATVKSMAGPAVDVVDSDGVCHEVPAGSVETLARWSLNGLNAAHAAIADAKAAEFQAVLGCRLAGLSFQDISDALGSLQPNVTRKYGARVEQAMVELLNADKPPAELAQDRQAALRQMQGASAEYAEFQAVLACRTAGVDWDSIGKILGIDQSAVVQKFGRRVSAIWIRDLGAEVADEGRAALLDRLRKAHAAIEDAREAEFEAVAACLEADVTWDEIAAAVGQYQPNAIAKYGPRMEVNRTVRVLPKQQAPVE